MILNSGIFHSRSMLAGGLCGATSDRDEIGRRAPSRGPAGCFFPIIAMPRSRLNLPRCVGLFGCSKRAAAAVLLATWIAAVVVLTISSIPSPGLAAAAEADERAVPASPPDVVPNADEHALEIGPPVSENGATDDLRLYREEASLTALNSGTAAPNPDSLRRLQDLLGVEFDRIDGMSVGTQWVSGVPVSSVRRDSVAGRAGVRGPRHMLHCALDLAVAAAGAFLPPLLIALPMIDQAEIGESQDLIIAVDGDRVRNAYELEAHLRGLGPSDVIYLTVVRGQNRHQLRVPLGSVVAP